MNTQNMKRALKIVFIGILAFVVNMRAMVQTKGQTRTGEGASFAAGGSGEDIKEDVKTPSKALTQKLTEKFETFAHREFVRYGNDVWHSVYGNGGPLGVYQLSMDLYNYDEWIDQCRRLLPKNSAKIVQAFLQNPNAETHAQLLKNAKIQSTVLSLLHAIGIADALGKSFEHIVSLYPNAEDLHIKWTSASGLNGSSTYYKRQLKEGIEEVLDGYILALAYAAGLSKQVEIEPAVQKNIAALIASRQTLFTNFGAICTQFGLLPELAKDDRYCNYVGDIKGSAALITVKAGMLLQQRWHKAFEFLAKI